MKGKFIVLYGINNLGKSTQAKMLVDRLVQEGYTAEYLKYPVYDLEPSGTLINEYLREGNPHNLSAREIQLMYVWNREQYESTLLKKLESGVHIVAEDYVGTGLAWGIGTGVDEQFMKYINAHLHRENIAFLFDGARFTEATEGTHKHETNDELMQRVRDVHARLGNEFGWIKIDANESREKIHEEIWKRVKGIV